MSISPPAITNYFYILSQSWSTALKHHNLWKHKELNQFCYWTLHSLYLNATGHNFLTYDFDHLPVQWDNEDVESGWIKKLKTVCPALINDQTNQMHWDAKAKKHGSCVVHYNIQNNNWNGITSSKQYLKKAAELATTYNMGQYLQNFRLGQMYNATDLAQAIQAQIGVEPQIRFLREDQQKYLHEIYLYFDENFVLMPAIFGNHVTEVMYEQCKDNKVALLLPQHNTAASSSSSDSSLVLPQHNMAASSSSSGSSRSHRQGTADQHHQQ